MAKESVPPNAMSFSAETFAKLTPHAYLQALLTQSPPVRPSGRSLDGFRDFTINTGSLTHSNGSAVVRCGDTAIVCGVRAEILAAADIPHLPPEDTPEADIVESLGLLVPNVELSTGCSPAHLPGNPPGTLAQSLSYRLQSLLHDAQIINPVELTITHLEPAGEDDTPDEGPKVVTKAYWTLYIDVLCIALDGNPFDTIWTAVLAALRNTMLPKAWWDVDQNTVVCTPNVSESRVLHISTLPLATTFGVFSTASPYKDHNTDQNWVLADPDEFEEEVCNEMLTLVVLPNDKSATIMKLESTGGHVIDRNVLQACLSTTRRRARQFETALSAS